MFRYSIFLFGATVLGLLLFIPAHGYSSIARQPFLRTLPVFLDAPPTGAEKSMRQLADRLQAMPGFVLVQKRADAAVSLHIIQDEKAHDGLKVVASPGLKNAFLDWTAFDAPLTASGLSIFWDNLQIVRRMQGFDEDAFSSDAVTINLSLYEPGINLGDAPSTSTNHIQLEERIWHLTKNVPVVDNYARLSQNGERAVLLTAQNNTDQEVYIYGINITKSGKIIVFLPRPTTTGNDHDDARIAPKSSRTFDDFSLVLEEDTEAVYIVRAFYPLDCSRLESYGFNTALSSNGILLQNDSQSTW